METDPHPLQAGDDLFLLPYEAGKYCLYAPLKRYLAVVNAKAAEAVRKFQKAGEKGLSPEENKIVAKFKTDGILTAECPRPPLFPDNYAFRPFEVTLFLTSRCNLRCRYCYADAGHKTIDMPWPVARAAIDLAAENAGWLGHTSFCVGFHGGGEPTLAWSMLIRCVAYAREKADLMGLDVSFFAATNGFLSKTQRTYMAEHFSNINVSLDGPRDIQDYNRPTIGQQGSYQTVRDTLTYFNDVGLDFGIRTTVTRASVGRMTEIVEDLRSRFRFIYLQMEPVWLCGRCVHSEDPPPADDLFIENFIRAFKRGQELGIQVSYSGARLDTLTSKFCAAPGDSFTVLPEGIVTSCYEVTEPSDPKAAIFHFGSFNPATGKFEFDFDRLEALRQLTVDKLPFCEDCFCKWHCAGDCLSKAFDLSQSFQHSGSIRCKINRALTLAWIKFTVEQALLANPTSLRGGQHGG